ncbi:hypothetical protein C5O80_32190 [Burkholderia sp. SRS-46]|nr:hypothetical protein C5O80_32190 [Burkholderia sp. SRS-46]
MFLTALDAGTRRLAHDVRVAHPFRREPVVGADAALRCLHELAGTLDAEVDVHLRFDGDTGAAVAWRCGPADRRIDAVTLALTNADGEIAELRIAVRPLPFVAPWRARFERVTAVPRDVDADDTAQPDDTRPVQRRMPFPLSDDVAFHGPAFVKPVRGVDAVSHVLGYAGAVYGECDYGPALRNGAHFLRAFTSKQLPLEIVSIAHLDADDRIDEWTAYMQPWDNMLLFRERLRAHLGDYLDASYYGAS